MSATKQTTARRHELLFPFILVFIEIITYLSTDMYLPALPSIASYFNVDQDTAQYTQTFWFLGSMSLQLFLGPLCEVYGRKQVLNIGILVFIITSLVCGLTSDINILLLARFFQGTTVCIVIVAGYALIHELYTGQRAVQILAIMGSVTILAPAMGPMLGAIIITFSHWQNIFLLLAGCGVIGIIGITLVVPNRRSSEVPKINLRQEVDAYKLILTNSTFMRIAAMNGLLIINFFIWIVESPFIIISRYQWSEFYFGVLQLVVFLGFIIGAQIARRLVVKLSPRSMCIFGFTGLASSLSLFLLFSLLDYSVLSIVFCMTGIAVGSSSMSGVFNRLAISSSTAPMSHRVAIYTLIVSLAACVGSYAVTWINDQSFLNIGCLMLFCFLLAVGLFISLQNKISDTHV